VPCAAALFSAFCLHIKMREMCAGTMGILVANGKGGNSFGWDIYRGFVPVLGQLISDVSARHFAMHKNVSSARASEIYVRINIHVSEREK